MQSIALKVSLDCAVVAWCCDRPEWFDTLTTMREIIIDRDAVCLMAIAEKLYNGGPVTQNSIMQFVLNNTVEISPAVIQESFSKAYNITSVEYFNDCLAKLLKRYKKIKMKQLVEKIDEMSDEEINEYVDREILRKRLNSNNKTLHIADIIERMENDKENKYIDCGIDFFNTNQGGLRKGEVHLIAARPSVGKTTYALNMMRRAMFSGRSILFNSAEVPMDVAVRKIICSAIPHDERAYEKGEYDPALKGSIETFKQYMINTHLFINDKCNIDIDAMLTKARAVIRQKNIDMWVIDHLHALTMQKQMTEYERLSYMIGEIKELTRDFNIVTVCLAQMNRGGDGNDDPQMKDIRGCGTIEQVADVIIFLKDGGFVNGHESIDNIIIKNRNGKTGKFNMKFDKEVCKIYD